MRAGRRPDSRMARRKASAGMATVPPRQSHVERDAQRDPIHEADTNRLVREPGSGSRLGTVKEVIVHVSLRDRKSVV